MHTSVKNFCLSLFFLLTFTTSYSQIVANDDSGTINGITGGYLQYGVLYNDSLNGGTVTTNEVTINTISTTCPCLTLDSYGAVYLDPGTPPGTYTLTYGICEIANPTNCDTAIITVNVCSLNPPTISNVVQPGCGGSPGTISFSGLPSGFWQIRVRNLWNSTTSIIGGSQPTGSMVIPNPNVSYGFTLIYGGCQSEEIYFTPNPAYGIQLTGTATHVDTNGDGFVNVGDMVNYQFSVTNTAACPLENIVVSTTNSNHTVIGGPIPSLAAGATDNTTFTGTHALTQNDINFHNGFGLFGAEGYNNGSVVAEDFDVIIPDTLPISDGVRLNVFIDSNNNGIQDSSEQNFPYGVFTYQINNGTVHNVYSSNGTLNLYESNPLNTYNFTCSTDANYINACIPQYSINPSSYSNMVVSNGSGITTYNFPVTIVPCVDSAVFLISNSAGPRPNLTYNVRVLYKNFGNQTIPSGTITFTKDNLLSVVGVTPAGSTITPTGFTYNFTNLVPNQSVMLTVTLQVPNVPAVAIGDLITNAVSLSIPTGDTNTLNNNSSLTQAVSNSYDPNAKTESHGGRIVHSSFTADDYLTYTIQFENTGNANAINIRVNDVLDAKLDETSIRMVRSSHAYVLDRTNQNLTWKFNGINLPPSNGSATVGHGDFTFQVKPKPGYAIGDIIPNTASIYFDSNPAVVTAPCLTEFVQSLGTNEQALNSFNYYPNPVTNKLTVSNNTTIETIEITSVLGQKVKMVKVDALQAEIDLADLSKGIYFVKASADGQEKTVKVIKN